MSRLLEAIASSHKAVILVSATVGAFALSQVEEKPYADAIDELRTIREFNWAAWTSYQRQQYAIPLQVIRHAAYDTVFGTVDWGDIVHGAWTDDPDSNVEIIGAFLSDSISASQLSLSELAKRIVDTAEVRVITIPRVYPADTNKERFIDRVFRSIESPMPAIPRVYVLLADDTGTVARGFVSIEVSPAFKEDLDFGAMRPRSVVTDTVATFLGHYTTAGSRNAWLRSQLRVDGPPFVKRALDRPYDSIPFASLLFLWPQLKDLSLPQAEIALPLLTELSTAEQDKKLEIFGLTVRRQVAIVIGPLVILLSLSFLLAHLLKARDTEQLTRGDSTEQTWIGLYDNLLSKCLTFASVLILPSGASFLLLSKMALPLTVTSVFGVLSLTFIVLLGASAMIVISSLRRHVVTTRVT